MMRWDVVSKKNGKLQEFIRFSIVGVIASGIHYLVYYLLQLISVVEYCLYHRLYSKPHLQFLPYHLLYVPLKSISEKSGRF